MPLSTLIEAGLAGYILFGSPAIGYILMRSGWPAIRTIGLEYKGGLSVISGAALATGIAILSFAPRLLNPVGLLYSNIDLLLLNTALACSGGVLIFTAKRNMPGRRKMKVSVPKRAVTASIISQMVLEKMPAQSYVKAASPLAGPLPTPEPMAAHAQISALPKVTPPGTGSELRVSELKTKLISKKEKEEEDRAWGMATQPAWIARPAARGTRQESEIIFEPTKEVIEQIVEKQKKASAEKTAPLQKDTTKYSEHRGLKPAGSLKQPPTETTPTAHSLNAKSSAAQPPQKPVFAVPSIKALPAPLESPEPAKQAREEEALPAIGDLGKAAGFTDEGRKGFFSFIFGSKNPHPAHAKLQRHEHAATVQPPQPLREAAVSMAPAQKEPGTATPKPAFGKTGKPPAGIIAAPMQPYSVKGHPSAEKIAQLRKRLSDFDTSKPLGELLSEKLAPEKEPMHALYENIYEMPSDTEMQKKPAEEKKAGKDVDEIIALLEHQKAQRLSKVTTREMRGEELKDSTSFIRHELRERLGLEPRPAMAGQKAEPLPEALPKSARLLREILKGE